MAALITQEASLTSVANAIRTKGGTSSQLTYPAGFVDAINAIPTGGGGSDDYFYVEAIEEGTMGFTPTGTVDVELQYSTDKTNWTDYTLDANVWMNAGQKVYWKNNKDYLSNDFNNRVEIKSNKTFNVGGRINSLINNIDGKGCYDYAFIRLFFKSKVVDASALILNEYVAPNCYYGMFQNCTSLTTAPELPATTLSIECYYYMFSGCTSLTTAPELPATNLKLSCYYYMFDGCTSLTTAPELPATTLYTRCYLNMFNGCTSLKVYSESGEGHDKPWSIPTNGNITGSTYAQTNMFNNVETDNVPTSFPGTTGQQFTYYTQNTPV